MYLFFQKKGLRKIFHILLALFFAIIVECVEVKYFVSIILILFILFLYVRIKFNYLNISGNSLGEFFFLFGSLIAFFISFPNIKLFQMSMLLLGTADSMASLWGAGFGKNKYHIFNEERTFEGTFVFFTISFVLCFSFGCNLLTSIFVAIALSFVEAVSIYGSDNLLLPVLFVFLFKFLIA